mmetsp:Transcript_11841/g.34268  ORF Transcript_11841/g.34268 Transcript_11841/m.34268 type:complete len:221 (-) Transcript_11841:99-761(-)
MSINSASAKHTFDEALKAQRKGDRAKAIRLAEKSLRLQDNPDVRAFLNAYMPSPGIPPAATTPGTTGQAASAPRFAGSPAIAAQVVDSPPAQATGGKRPASKVTGPDKEQPAAKRGQLAPDTSAVNGEWQKTFIANKLEEEANAAANSFRAAALRKASKELLASERQVFTDHDLALVPGSNSGAGDKQFAGKCFGRTLLPKVQCWLRAEIRSRQATGTAA